MFIIFVVVCIADFVLLLTLGHKLKFIGLAKLFMPDNENPEVYWDIIGAHWGIFQTFEGVLLLATGTITGFLFFLLLAVPGIRKYKKLVSTNAAARVTSEIETEAKKAQDLMADAEKMQAQAKQQMQEAQKQIARSNKIETQAQKQISEIKQTTQKQIDKMRTELNDAKRKCQNAAGAMHRRKRKEERRGL